MRAWIVSAAAGVGHLLLVVAALLALGHPVPGAGALLGLFLLGAAPVRWWQAGLRGPLVLATLGLLTAVVLELVTPGPWVTVLGPDVLTVGTPVLWSYAVASPLWLAVCGLAGLGEASLRPGGLPRGADEASRQRPGWGRAAVRAVATTVLWFAAVFLTGLGRGWATTPPPMYGLVTAIVLVLGATLLLCRLRLVTPWLVLLVATGVAAVALWWQAPSGGSDAAAGLLDGSAVALALALLLGLVEALVRGIVRLARPRPDRHPAAPQPVPERVGEP